MKEEKANVRRGLVACFAAILIVILLTSTGDAIAARRQQLHGYVTASVAPAARMIGMLPDTAHLTLEIGLSTRNEASLDSLIREIYNPAGSLYRHYLDPQEFEQEFGPTEEDYRKVIDFMTAHGFEITGTYPNRIVIDVRGSVANIDSTFRVRIGLYHDPVRDRTFYAPNVPATIAGPGVAISDVIGLDDFAPPRPADLVRPSPGEKIETTGSGPGGLFIGSDYRAAYASGVTLDGKGQVVGLFEFGPYWTKDIETYENQAGIPHVRITNVLLDGFSGVPGSNEDVGEESLDIENALAMAPGASFIVYEGNNAVDILSRMASDDKAKQITCSFSWYPPSSTENRLYQELDAQGQAFYEASGDGGAYADTVTIFSPTDNPNITCVGGTSLTTGGPGGPWSAETAWNGSGGGISKTFLSPNYQIGVGNTANQGSRTYRDFPDVSATAAFQFYFVYNNGRSGGIGGTSGAAPLWAGFTALVNEQAIAHGKPVVGFLNPAIYSIGKGKSFDYNPDFHDVAVGDNLNNKSPYKFFARPGYDLVTGWGTPDGIYTINALAGITTPDFSLSTEHDTLTVNQVSINKFNVEVSPLNGFTGDVSIAVGDLPDGVTASAPTPASAGAVSFSLTATIDARTGTTPVTITGTSDGTSHTIMVPLTVDAAPTETTPVNLVSHFNRTNAIVSDGSHYSGGLDGNGYAYSENLLGKSVRWNNTAFDLGPAGAADAVSGQGQTIPLPAGKYASLRILATGVNGSQKAQQLVFTYADTSEGTNQSFSDWYSPSDFPGENVAVSMPYRNTGAGKKNNGPFYLYGYSFKLDPSKALYAVTLPSDPDLEVLAMTLASPVIDTSLGVSAFELKQNYPNPFNAVTKIPYRLTSSRFVTLKIYDVLGREVETLVDETQGAGSYLVPFDGSRLASGVYFYRLKAGSFIQMKKLMLLK